MAARSSHDQDRQRRDLDFQHLVDLHYGPLYRFAMSLTHTETDAGDLVQEAFLTWAKKGYQLRDASKVKAWLFTTLHRQFLETQRRVSRFPHLELTEVVDELPIVAPHIVDRMDARDLVQILGQLDPQFQGAVALFYLEDYSYAEIAAILEVPLGTVKSRLSRGLVQLKKLVLEHARRTRQAGKHDA